jgi:Flp pilus assembly protein TadG
MVEFGLVALLFVLMLFGIVDFGMLLNGWINVSTGSAAGARWAALGNYLNDSSSPSVAGIYSQAKASSIVPGLSTSGVKVIVTYTSSSGAYGPTTYCRGYTKVVRDGTTTPVVSLTPPAVPTYQYDPLDGRGNKVQLSGANVVCAGEPSGVNPPDSTTTPEATPSAGDSIQVTVIADTFEVITPLVRPFFGCSTTATHCYVPLTSSTTMRYEGSVV